MKKLLLLALIVLGGVMDVSAWNDMYLICKENNNWNVETYSENFKFVMVDATHYRATVPGSYINSGNWHFRFREKNGSWWNIGPIGSTEDDNKEVTGTAVQTNYQNSSNASFFIRQNATASFVQIFIEWADPYWKVTASVITDTYTIAFPKPANWEAVKAYAYYYVDNCAKVEPLGAWSGSAMTYNSESNIYTASVPAIDGGEIIFTDGDGHQYPASGGFDIEENGVYCNTGLVEEINVSAGTNGIATFSSAYPLDFSTTTDISAYVVSALSSTEATLTQVDYTVPAETGLIIVKKTGKSENDEFIPTAITSTSPVTNYLEAAVNGKTVEENEAYVLYSGKFHPANAGTIPAGKAYLKYSDVIAAGARSLSLVFEDEVSGIESVKSDVKDNVFYNLAGQRITAPAKGLYIVNGKKIIVK